MAPVAPGAVPVTTAMGWILSDRPVSRRVTWVTLMPSRGHAADRLATVSRCGQVRFAVPPSASRPAVVVAPGGARAPQREPRRGPRVRAALSRAVPFVAALAAVVPAAAPAAEPGDRTFE